MPRIDRKIRRRGPELLTDAQEMNLLIGAPGGFANDDERRKAWFAHRDELMAALNPCTRPAGFWEFEAPGGKLPGEKGWAALERLALLTPEEKHLARKWGLIGSA
jgi:hypothetical protein